jgi:hypothetical protein
MEINSYPALHKFTAIKKIMMPKLVDTALDIVLYLKDNWDNYETVLKDIQNHVNINSFQIIYNDLTGYSILDP